MAIHEKLLKIQSSISVPKNQYNKFGNYDYRSCEDILFALKPILQTHKCTVTVNDDLIFIGNRYYIKATATLVDCESGESVSNQSFAREEESKKGMDSSQITGTASSYARKYALNGLLLLDDVKDADTNEHKDQNMNAPQNGNRQSTSKNKNNQGAQATKDKSNGPINKTQLDSLRKRFESNGIDEAKVCCIYNISEISKLSSTQYGHVNKYFDRIKDQCSV